VPKGVYVLHISNNQLSDMTSFSNVQGLTVLDISFNQISDLSGEAGC
jgi:Leucine-rich repeat (LRR) protein